MLAGLGKIWNPVYCWRDYKMHRNNLAIQRVGLSTHPENRHWGFKSLPISAPNRQMGPLLSFRKEGDLAQCDRDKP